MKKKLRYLINKINSKPKLVKALKIIKRIVNVCVYAFTIFMVILLSVGSCSNRYNFQPQKDEISVKEAIDYTDNLKGFMLNDFLGNRNTIEYIYNRNTYFFNNGNPNAALIDSYYDRTHLSHYTALFTNVDFDDYGWISSSNEIYFNAIRVTCHNSGGLVGLANSVRFITYRFVLYDNNTSTEVGTPYLYHILFPSGAYNSSSGSYISHTWDLISSPDINGYINIFRANTAIWEMAIGDDYSEGYSAGQADGYSSGYTNGYNDGDYAGYNRGYTEGAQQSDTNIFSIIQSGFSSVTTLFNIQIFPGITLATLMFIPMIVVLVIALMHIFKG